MSSKIKSILYSVFSGLFLVTFWVFTNQLKTEANLPITEILDFVNESEEETILENQTQEIPTPKPIEPPPKTDNNPLATTEVPKVPVKKPSGPFVDGEYLASSPTPWGDLNIKMTVKNGNWSNVHFVQIPDSPPSQYAASILAKQAINAQNGSIDGVSGATYTSDAFRDNLSQILQQSKA